MSYGYLEESNFLVFGTKEGLIKPKDGKILFDSINSLFTWKLRNPISIPREKRIDQVRREFAFEHVKEWFIDSKKKKTHNKKYATYVYLHGRKKLFVNILINLIQVKREFAFEHEIIFKS